MNWYFVCVQYKSIMTILIVLFVLLVTQISITYLDLYIYICDAFAPMPHVTVQPSERKKLELEMTYRLDTYICLLPAAFISSRNMEIKTMSNVKTWHREKLFEISGG